MKAVKTTIGNSGISLYIKALIMGVLSMFALTIVMMCIVSFLLLISGTLPLGILEWITLVIGSFGSLIGGYVSARITKMNGMIIGSIVGATTFVIILIAGIISGDTISYILLLKLIMFVICGALGGIKGVNKKDKLKIK